MSRARGSTLRQANESMMDAEQVRVRRATIRKNTVSSSAAGPPVVERMSEEEMREREEALTAKMRWEDERGKSDMIKMEQLSLENLLSNLEERYDAERYYTYVGSIISAVNPYYRLHHKYYTVSITKQYRERQLSENPPHIFAIADLAFRTLRTEAKSVGVVISGESGAGKSETTKLIINFIAASSREVTQVESQLIESSSLLEAFGNAKTVRNHNSSRFGKLIKVRFSKDHRIRGAEIETYLLEKSRVTMQAEEERNYHFFYQLCDGAPAALRKELGLKPSSEFKITSVCQDIGNDEAAEFRATQDAMTLFGWSPDFQNFLFRMCAAILHMGDIVFEENEKRQRWEVANKEAVEEAARLLRVPVKALELTLTTQKISAGRQKITKNYTEHEAVAARDTVARELYMRLFDLVVRKVNEALKPDDSDELLPEFIGVLDIFGFENFRVNSFEQLCINFANEKLHLQFIDHVFKQEQEEYAAEGIEWGQMDAAELDRTDCLKLLEARDGIFSILDEECFLQSSSDEKFLERLLNTFERKNKYFARARMKRGMKPAFTINHFAEPVTYTVEDFRLKNQMLLPQEAVTLFGQSEEPLMKELFPADEGQELDVNPRSRSSSKSKRRTISSLFKQQLTSLKLTLDATIPLYVKCLKPNSVREAHNFDREMIGKQIAYSGMVETVRIRALGYPHRMSFERLLTDNRVLWSHAGQDPKPTARDAKVLLEPLEGLDEGAWQVGKTKVFFRSNAQETLATLRVAAQAVHAIRMQRYVRMFLARSLYMRKRAAAKLLQTNVRSFLVNARLRHRVAACVGVVRETEMARRHAAFDAAFAAFEGEVDTLVQKVEGEKVWTKAETRFEKEEAAFEERVEAFEESVGELAQAIADIMGSVMYGEDPSKTSDDMEELVERVRSAFAARRLKAFNRAERRAKLWLKRPIFEVEEGASFAELEAQADALGSAEEEALAKAKELEAELAELAGYVVSEEPPKPLAVVRPTKKAIAAARAAWKEARSESALAALKAASKEAKSWLRAGFKLAYDGQPADALDEAEEQYLEEAARQQEQVQQRISDVEHAGGDASGSLDCVSKAKEQVLAVRKEWHAAILKETQAWVEDDATSVRKLRTRVQKLRMVYEDGGVPEEEWLEYLKVTAQVKELDEVQPKRGATTEELLASMEEHPASSFTDKRARAAHSRLVSRFEEALEEAAQAAGLEKKGTWKMKAERQLRAPTSDLQQLQELWDELGEDAQEEVEIKLDDLRKAQQEAKAKEEAEEEERAKAEAKAAARKAALERGKLRKKREAEAEEAAAEKAAAETRASARSPRSPRESAARRTPRSPRSTATTSVPPRSMRKATPVVAEEDTTERVSQRRKSSAPRSTLVREEHLAPLIKRGLDRSSFAQDFAGKLEYSKALTDLVCSTQSTRDPDHSDALFECCQTLMEELVKEDPRNPHIKINCGTMLINWSTLRVRHAKYTLKGGAVLPLLSRAQALFDGAMDSGLLDSGGMHAVHERLAAVDRMRSKVATLDGDTAFRLKDKVARQQEELEELLELHAKMDAKLDELEKRARRRK